MTINMDWPFLALRLCSHYGRNDGDGKKSCRSHLLPSEQRKMATADIVLLFINLFLRLKSCVAFRIGELVVEDSHTMFCTSAAYL